MKVNRRFVRAGSLASIVLFACQAFGSGLDPLVPFNYRIMGVDQCVREIRSIRETTGLRRFLLTGPGFNDVMFAPFGEDVYPNIGKDVAAVRRAVAGTDIEISWWCSPSIRYVSGFERISDAEGNRSSDNKMCPLDPAFAADFVAKIKSVAEAHPTFICIEDDYTLAWSRGLKDIGGCFCERHLAAFARRFGRVLSAAEIAAAFERRTAADLPARRAFSEVVRDSLVALARQVRTAVDSVDPSIRIILSQPGTCDQDGDATEALARAFAGKTRPAIRPFGAIYGAETTPADVPGALSHAVWTLEHLPRDIETFYEADTYPHNRFYSSSTQLLSLMAGAMTAGTDDFMFYCTQYLDDPLEDRGYFETYRRYRPRLEAVRSFLREKDARLVGVRPVWTPDAIALTRQVDTGAFGLPVLQAQAYLLAKFGFPYTTRADAEGPALLIGDVAEVLTDAEVARLLSGGVLLDAPAASILAKRGFGHLLGADVERVAKLPAVAEEIQPAAGCTCRGRQVNAFYILSAGSEGSVNCFARLTPRDGTEVWSQFKGLKDADLSPAVTLATNARGGRVAILATSVVGNRGSGLYNLRKQELMRNLLARLADGRLPVSAVNAPGQWLLAAVSADGREMLVMLNNLSGEDRTGVRLAFGGGWESAEASLVLPDGSRRSLGAVASEWTVPVELKLMQPEWLILGKGR